MASRPGMAKSLRTARAWQLDQPANALRYLEQMLDWPGLVTREGRPRLVRAQDVAFSALARDPRAGRLGPVRCAPAFLRARWMPDEELSGFGPVGFLVGPRFAGRPRACATRLPEKPGSAPTSSRRASSSWLIGWSVAFLLSAAAHGRAQAAVLSRRAPAPCGCGDPAAEPGTRPRRVVDRGLRNGSRRCRGGDGFRGRAGSAAASTLRQDFGDGRCWRR